LAALAGYHVDVEVAVVLRREGNPLAVGRKLGEEFQTRAGGDPPGDASGSGREPQVAGIAEDNLVLIKRQENASGGLQASAAQNRLK